MSAKNSFYHSLGLFVLGAVSLLLVMSVFNPPETSSLISRSVLFSTASDISSSDVVQITINKDNNNVIFIDDSGLAKNYPISSLQATASSNKVYSPTLTVDKTPAPVRSDISSINKAISKDVNTQFLDQYSPSLFNDLITQTAVTYPSLQDKTKDTLLVFSDPTCTFCREFHFKYLPRLQKDGYEVRYMPIARVSGKTHDGTNKFNEKVRAKLQTAVCSTDYEKELEVVFRTGGTNIPKQLDSCANSNFNIANNINLSAEFVSSSRGTPAIYSSSGYASNGSLPNGTGIVPPGIARFNEASYQDFVATLELFKNSE